MFNSFKIKIMKKRILWLRYLFIFLSIACASIAYAQEITVTGKVKDAADGSSIPGATVIVKGTTTGTVTDIDGKYSIKVQSNATLVFSYMGYQTQEVPVAGKQMIDVSLAASVTSLNEVVVIGYGQVKKQDATGAVTAIDQKDFDQGAITFAPGADYRENCWCSGYNIGRRSRWRCRYQNPGRKFIKCLKRSPYSY